MRQGMYLGPTKMEHSSKTTLLNIEQSSTTARHRIPATNKRPITKNVSTRKSTTKDTSAPATQTTSATIYATNTTTNQVICTPLSAANVTPVGHILNKTLVPNVPCSLNMTSSQVGLLAIIVVASIAVAMVVFLVATVILLRYKNWLRSLFCRDEDMVQTSEATEPSVHYRSVIRKPNMIRERPDTAESEARNTNIVVTPESSVRPSYTNVTHSEWLKQQSGTDSQAELADKLYSKLGDFSVVQTNLYNDLNTTMSYSYSNVNVLPVVDSSSDYLAQTTHAKIDNVYFEVEKDI